MKEKKKIINKKFIVKSLKRISLIGATVVALFLGQASQVFATDDPLTVINNLSTFIFSIIRAIGMILLGWGIVQIGLALKSHDPSQRANRFSNSSRWSNYNICKTNIRPYYRWIKKEIWDKPKKACP